MKFVSKEILFDYEIEEHTSYSLLIVDFPIHSHYCWDWSWTKNGRAISFPRAASRKSLAMDSSVILNLIDSSQRSLIHDDYFLLTKRHRRLNLDEFVIFRRVPDAMDNFHDDLSWFCHLLRSRTISCFYSDTIYSHYLTHIQNRDKFLSCVLADSEIRWKTKDTKMILAMIHVANYDKENIT